MQLLISVQIIKNNLAERKCKPKQTENRPMKNRCLARCFRFPYPNLLEASKNANAELACN